MLLCDENGTYIDFDEEDIVAALNKADDSDVKYFVPTDTEVAEYQRIYDKLTAEMMQKYQAAITPLKIYNKRKVENWAEIQREQLNIEIADMLSEIDELSTEEAIAKDFLEKIDIRKKIDEKKKHLQRFQELFHKKDSSIQEEAMKEIKKFDDQFNISPILVVNIVLKF